MEAMVPAPALQGLRAPTCLLQTLVLEVEPRPSSPTRLPVRSRSRPPPCAPVSPNTGVKKHKREISKSFGWIEDRRVICRCVHCLDRGTIIQRNNQELKLINN